MHFGDISLGFSGTFGISREIGRLGMSVGIVPDRLRIFYLCVSVVMRDFFCESFSGFLRDNFLAF